MLTEKIDIFLPTIHKHQHATSTKQAVIANMMRYPHQMNKFTGVVVLTPCILQARMTSVFNNVMCNNPEKADRILRDTIRIFRTATRNDFDHITYSYLLSNLLHMAVEVRMEKYAEVQNRIYNMLVSLALPNELM